MQGSKWEKRLTMIRKRYQLFPSRDVVDRILESDWPKGTPGNTQTRVVVLNATFSWLLSPCTEPQTTKK